MRTQAPEAEQLDRTSDLIQRVRHGGAFVCRDGRSTETRTLAVTLGRSDIHIISVTDANGGDLRGIDPLPDLVLNHDVDTADMVFGEIVCAALRAYRHKYGIMPGVRS